MIEPLATHPEYPLALEQALAWLHASPQEDPLRDLAPLRTHLLALADLDLPPLQQLKIVELFQFRVHRTGPVIKSLLLDATLPTPNRLRAIAHGMIDVHGLIAAAYLRVICKAPPEKLRSLRRTPAELCARGLNHLEHQFEMVQLISVPSPHTLWYLSQTLYRMIHTGLPLDATLPHETVSAENSMKTMLALAAAQPDSFAAREISFLTDYLRRQSASVRIESYPTATTDQEFWLDGGRHLAPMASVRTKPDGRESVLLFSCGELGNIAREHLRRLEAGESLDKIELLGTTLPLDYRSVLERAATYWTQPPKRHTHRRYRERHVKLCAHLAPLWKRLRGGDTEEGDAELPVSEWMVLNEGPHGYAITHIDGELSGLVPGCAIGLRAEPGASWHICVVRWARSGFNERVELGLEVVAPHASAVHIARKEVTAETTSLPALLLPSLPALARSEVLMVARGDYAPGTFALLQDTADRVQITECHAHRLAMHTACVEIFEFERKLSPR